MSKPKKQQYPYNFGRVFFPDESKPIPDVIYFQPLGNHVGNVKRLVKYWRKDDFPSDSSFQRVKVAADIHDVGKPQQFELRVQTNRNSEFDKYIYSFRGHRFLAESQDAWTQSLARGHHDFSVGDICRDSYELQKEAEYREILTKDSLAYAKELYILEMCDQIEAELACRTFEDKKQAESRAFMDFTISKLEENVYQIDPWIFVPDEIELTMKSWIFNLSDKDKADLEKAQTENKDLGKTLDKIVKQWWKKCEGKPESNDIKKITLQPYAKDEETEIRDCKLWYQQLAGFDPNPMQEEVFEKITQSDDVAILLKAATGSGKFETILIPALAQGYRLILPLPARSLIDDQKQRVEKYLKRISELYPNREFSYVIDTGSQMYRYVYLNGEAKTRTHNPRRHLYKGDVILTTLDKFIYRYFGYGDKQKSFTFSLRIHQEKTLICFDEAHSYDDIAFTNFQGLVQSLYEAGRSLVLMTATMPEEYVNFFDYLEVIDYVESEDNNKKLLDFQKKHLSQPHLNQRSFKWINDIERNSNNPEPFQQRISKTVIEEWQATANRRIITVVQTVKDAVEIYKQLKQKLGLSTENENRELFLYHGRLDGKFRQQVYTQLKKRDDNSQPYILVTTSAIEVGCDLNSETLISEICLPESLIQRVGRCNRKGNVPDAKVIVVGKVLPDNIPFFAQSLDEAGWEKYQNTLRDLSEFDAKEVGECIARSRQIEDYRVVELFSMLHDYVYSADLTCQSSYEKGLIVTRSWTPSVTLVYDNDKYDEIKDMPQITVPIDRLIGGKNAVKYNTQVLERYYDKENTRWTTKPLSWGCAYRKDIIVHIKHKPEEGSEQSEYDYQEDLGFVDLPKVFVNISNKNSGFDQRLLYKYTENNQEKKAIISYTGSIRANV